MPTTVSEMTDEQRRAMFARLNAGGNGGGGTHRNPYEPEPASKWEKFKAGLGGFWEGTKEGFGNVLNAYTFGGSDSWGWTHSYDSDSKASKLFAGISAGAAYSALGGLAGRAAAGAASGSKLATAGKIGGNLLKATGGFTAQDAVHDFREGQDLNYALERSLAVLEQAAGLYGSYSLIGAGHGALSSLGRLTKFGPVLESALSKLGGAVGKPVASLWASIGTKAPQLTSALENLHRAYTMIADATGVDLGVLKESGGITKKVILASLAAISTAVDEVQIQRGKTEALAAFRDGGNYKIEGEGPRNAVGTVSAAIVGTLGNPIEKFTRQGFSDRNKAIGAHEARKQLLEDQYAVGEITRAQYEEERAKLAAQKPFGYEGHTLWQVSSALSTFYNWKVGDAVKSMDLKDFAKVLEVLDGDTVKVQRKGKTETYRILGIDTPEISHNSTETADYLGDDAKRNAQNLLPVGSTVLVTHDSHAKANGTDKYGRQLGSVAAMPTGTGWTSKIPGVGLVVGSLAGRDLGERQLRDGLAAIRYVELAGRTDKGAHYEGVQAKAQGRGVGIWDPAAAEFNKPWIGHTKTESELYPQKAKTALDSLQTMLGLGLMTTGNSGILGKMGGTGKAVAQTWNAALAGMGAASYNERERANEGRVMRPPSTYVSDYDKRVYQALHGKEAPTPAEYDERVKAVFELFK